jgi:hypothetical protein
MIKYKRGETLNCIEGGFHIPCIINKDVNEGDYSAFIMDPVSGREFWVPVNQLDRDLQWKRNKMLKNLGI